jgi:aspartate carbamoyltransferase catalytic subunit
MHIVVVSFGPAGTIWPFYFADPAKAQEASETLAKSLGGPVMDDYGQSASFRKGEVHGVLMRDAELCSEAEIAGMVTNHQNQMSAQSRVQAMQGNSLVIPGGNGGMFRA